MSDPVGADQDAAFAEDAALITYFYLRVGIIALVAFLAVAVLRENASRAQTLSSISASWYTPVQSVFVAVLVAAGVSMIAIRARGVQEPLLNVAGLFAPVVAFVPTPEPVKVPCFHLPGAAAAAEQLPPPGGRWDPATCVAFVARIDGAVVPYFWVGSVVLAATLVYVAVRRRNPALEYRPAGGGLVRWLRERFLEGDVREPTRGEEVAGVVVAGVVWVAAIVWYGVGRTSFMDGAHAIAAGAVFLPMALVAFLAAQTVQRGSTAAARSHGPRARRWAVIAYRVVALAMLLGILATGGMRLLGWTDDSHHWFWALEWVLLLGFWVFWCVQTFEASIPRLSRKPARDQVI